MRDGVSRDEQPERPIESGQRVVLVEWINDLRSSSEIGFPGSEKKIVPTRTIGFLYSQTEFALTLIPSIATETGVFQGRQIQIPPSAIRSVKELFIKTGVK